MSVAFFEKPILNSPYAFPGRHWELDENGQPTTNVIEARRRSKLVTPVPQSKSGKSKKGRKDALEFDLGVEGLTEAGQAYDPEPIINEIRTYVETWRNLKPEQWGVTPQTRRLLEHWRFHDFQGVRPFFCQVEAVETLIWLTEVAPKTSPRGAKFWAHLEGANAEANPDLFRIGLKLATGAGKTTVMAMIIAWQTVNAVRHPGSKLFSKAFLIVAPGITIRDRLRVLLPNDVNSYYAEREIVPPDMMEDIRRAKIVITNYHAFKRRTEIELSKGTREALEGWRGERVETVETEGKMIRRVMGDLMGEKNIVVLNDEAHHCYRERAKDPENEDLTGDDRKEAERNNEAARLWISGIEAAKRVVGVRAVYDLSATPFFLRGSGYKEGTLFPWIVSDFSLMDAIECGIVKLPRVPISDNLGGGTPVYRNLWDHIGKKMPKKGRSGGKDYDPLKLPTELVGALDALYGHYEKIHAQWRDEGIDVPPVFIVVCNNTSTSKLVYDYISGFHRENDDETETFHQGRLELFRNFDEFGNRLAEPRTLLIDSEQLESGEALDKEFRDINKDAIERFRRELVQRTGNPHAGDGITDQDILREVMNTVGRKDRLGEKIRCVVSVSMLTEGWDANTVTHILGVRAFGTQLLCEQVVGRGLRRQSYALNDEGLFDVEYADILGIPFDFAAEPVEVKPAKPQQTIRVHAVRPERDGLEIRFPRVEGYRVDLPKERLTATFGPDSVLELTPELVGPSIVKVQGIVGEGDELTVEHLRDMRESEIQYRLAKILLYEKFRDPGEEPRLAIFNDLKRIVRQWSDAGFLRCTGSTCPGQVLYPEIAEMACNRIKAAITESYSDKRPIKAILSPYNSEGSTKYVNFTTSKSTRWQTAPDKSHVNWAICDSDWELKFCGVLEAHPRVLSYVKNQNLGFEVPYLMGSQPKRYIPDFIVRIDDGREDPLNLVVEIKGFRSEDAKEKSATMKAFWVPGVNNTGRFGRWDFAEFNEVFEFKDKFDALIARFVAMEAA